LVFDISLFLRAYTLLTNYPEPKMPVKPLSTALVNALGRPTAGQTLIWDKKLSGFGVRVTAGGKRVYIAQGRANGCYYAADPNPLTIMRKTSLAYGIVSG
jgi:hypothetical protein